MKLLVEAICSGSIEEFRPQPDLEPHLRRADEFIRLAALSAHGALEEAGFTSVANREAGGLILGTAYGPMQTNFEVLDQVASAQPVSPILFSHSVFNGAAGYLAKLFGLRGGALTCTDFSLPFCRGLEQARLMLLDGLAEWLLVLQVETYSSLLESRRSKTMAVPSRRPGAVCWLVSPTTVSTGRSPALELLELEPARDGADRLDDRCRLRMLDREYDCADALEAVALLGSLLTDAGPRVECRISSGLGGAQLVFQR